MTSLTSRRGTCTRSTKPDGSPTSARLPRPTEHRLRDRDREISRQPPDPKLSERCLPSVAGPDTSLQHPSISLLIMFDLGPAARAKARAMQATEREIEAHRRAINLQESSAIMLDRAHQNDKSRNARERAEHAREMLWKALAELEALRKAS